MLEAFDNTCPMALHMSYVCYADVFIICYVNDMICFEI